MTSLVPTKLLAAWCAVPVALSLVAAVDPGWLWLAEVADLGIALFAIVDAARTRRSKFVVERRVPRRWSAGRSQRVELVVRGAGPAFDLDQSLFDGAVAEGLPLRGLPGVVLSYTLGAPRRGRFTLGAHHLRTRSPFQLWVRQHDVVANDEILVLPDLAALQEYDLLARSHMQGLLTRTTRRPGMDAEFDRLRPWQRGDEYRLVDWRATARGRGPVVRQLRASTDHAIVFLLDCGRTMTAEHRGRPAFDWALDASLMVGHIALKQGDRVGLLGIGAHLRCWVPPTGGARGREQLLHEGCGLQAELEEPNWREAIGFLRQHLRKRALVVVFSNLVDDVTADAMSELFRSDDRHLVVWVCVRDAAIEELLLAPGRSPWERGAAAEVANWRREALEKVRGRGVHVIDATPDAFTPQVLGRYLEVKARSIL